MATLRAPGLDVTEFNFPPPQPSAVPGISVSEGVAPERITSLRNPSFETATSPQRAAYERSLAASNAPPTAAPAAPGLTQRATTALRAGFDSLRGTGSVPRQIGRVGLRAAGPVAGLGLEGAQAAEVAANPNATGLDVATQAAQGAGRLGAAGAGAALGAAAGSVIPVVGTVLGGLAGGAAGYFGADKAIEAGRSLLGTDPRAPADRLAAGAPAAAAPTAQPRPNPASQADVRRVDNAIPAAPAEPPAFFARTGNSFTGTGGNQVQAAGLRNPNVSIVPGAGAAETYAMADRIRTNNTATPTGAAVIDGAGADSARRAEFFDGANLRSAAARGSWSPRRGFQGDEAGVQAALAPILQRNRLREAGLKAETDLATTRLSTDAARANAQTQADATRYGADATVRAANLRAGYDLQLKLGDRMAQAEALRQAGGDPARAAQILAGTGRDPSTLTALAGAEQTRTAQTQTVQDKAIDNTRRALQVYGPDGKVNDGASAAAYNVVNKILPGFSNMSEASREKVLPQAQALASIFGKTYEGRQQGLQKLNPFNPRAPQLDSMPDFQGGKLVRQGLTGGLVPGSGANEYYVTDRNGVNHPLGQLNERELQLIDRNIKTGKWN